MSFELARAVWNYTGKDLDGTQTAILSRMAWYASEAGRDIFPTVSTLAAQTKYAIRTVHKTLKYLRDNQFLIVEESSKGRHAVTYKINIAKLQVKQQFTQSSSSIPDIEPCTTCTVGDQPCTICTVNTAPGALNPAPRAYIKTSKDESKDNNVVVGQKVLELAIKVAITEPDLRYFLGHYEIEAIVLQMEAMLMQKNIRSPKAWLTKALKDNYAVSTFTTPPLKPASHTIWSQKEHEARCKEAEKLSDPEHWAEKMLQENLTKLKAGSNQG